MTDIIVYFKGFFFGIAFIASFGPIFFTLLETSINRGFKPAAAIATGTFISDTFYITIAFFGVTAFFEDVHFKFWLGICGGILLLIFGAAYFFKKPKIERVELVGGKGVGYVGYALKGFVINTLNPFVFLLWFGAMLRLVSLEYTRSERILFFVGTLTCIYSSDLLKAFIADKIKHLLTKQLMIWINRAAGSVMLYFGADLLWKVLHGKGL